MLAGVALAGVSGCNTNPHAPDISAPSTVEPAAQGSNHHGKPPHQGIQLPGTLSVVYDRTPAIVDMPHHIVLWTANQSLKAELDAAYQKTSAATPDLQHWWTGAAYTAAFDYAQSWINADERPVGRVVISDTSVDSLTASKATVSFCQDMSMVYRGKARTNAVGPLVQPKHTNGERVWLTLVPSAQKGTWVVAAVATTAVSPQCPPLGSHEGSGPGSGSGSGSGSGQKPR